MPSQHHSGPGGTPHGPAGQPKAQRQGGGHPGNASPGGGAGERPHSGNPGHPGGRPGGKADPAGLAAVKGAVPRGGLWISAGLAWLASAATALLFWQVGTAIDQAGTVRPGTLTALIILAVLAAAAVTAGEWYSAWAGAQTERKLRQAILGRVFQRGPVAASGRAGELLSLSTHAVEKTANYRAGFLGPMLGAMSTPLLVLALMAVFVDPVTAGWLVLLIILVPLAVGAFQRLVKPIGANYRRSQGRLTAAFLEAVENLGTLVYARAADRTAADLAAAGESHRRSIMKLLAGNQLLIFVVDAAFSLSITVAATALATARLAGGQIGPGQALAIVLLTVLVIGPVDIIGQFFYIGIAGRASQRQIADHLAPDAVAGAAARSGAQGRQAEVAEAGDNSFSHSGSGATAAETGSVAGEVAPAALELRDVTGGWKTGRPVIAHANLRIEPGEQVALVGPSGAGKSTISALLQAQLTPESGQVLIAGADTRTTDPAGIRARLTVVEQAPYLFEGSIADNLRLARPGAPEDALWTALDTVGLSTEVRAMPRGLDEPVGARGQSLSGGQAQRLAIARAALRQAAPGAGVGAGASTGAGARSGAGSQAGNASGDILILDEPTSQVGLAAEAQVLDALDRLVAGRTVLMIAHRPAAIRAADRVIDIRDIQAGTPAGPTDPTGSTGSTHGDTTTEPTDGQETRV
ncbi:ABC transporter ATP-binding protein [Brevibacterium sp. 91QC2O2]|uniref:ATP-binding cassette domain-containing protein n=1 Tax=Brevibacterium sp. 91QC2O2 TaxID=2968458 RepID=UPI0027B8E623|nr:ABC transporter ATP-binding protein [Brevibacterium sp. 91QC2O2]